MSDLPLTLERLMNVGYVNLRGDANNTEFAAAVRETCETDLPLAANSMNGDDPRIFWLGPDEWLLVGDSARMAGLAPALSIALQHQHAAVNELSGGQVTFRLSGADARELLAKGCPLDLHPSVFGAGSCAQTGLAKAGVLLCGLADGAGFDLIVRRSFADYLWQWLLRAGHDYRIEVT